MSDVDALTPAQALVEELDRLSPGGVDLDAQAVVLLTEVVTLLRRMDERLASVERLIEGGPP